jgi:hypothetical protein
LSVTVLQGQVVEPDGAPVAGARVLITASPVPVPDIAQVTGPDGRFATTAPAPGAYRIAAYATGRATVEVEVDVSAGGHPPTVEFVLQRQE